MKTQLWNYLNGNKTIICLFIVAVLSQPFIQGLIGMPDLVEFLTWLFGALAAGSFTHHVTKGYLAEDKGN